MAFTPLIRPLNQNGTTFYTFSSAARDMSKCMANTQKEFVFSHFACINIPDFINTNNYDHSQGSGDSRKNSSSAPPLTLNKNYTQLGGVEQLLDRDSQASPQSIKTTSMELAESLQDYVFNFEELLIRESDDNSTDRSVAERVFWHWLNKTGAVQWDFDQSKIAPALVNAQKNRFVEATPTQAYDYEKVVKYLGSIDITNNVDISSDAYTEIYIYIPSEHGGTPTVLFEQVFDDNYDSTATYKVDGQYRDYILGQTQVTSDPVSVLALYDNAGNYSYDINGQELAWHTAPTTTQMSYGSGAFSANPKTTNIDGLCIDFNTNSYAEIVLGSPSNMDEFNKTGETFEFNAVLVYYDIVDLSSGDRTSNLYGILFLDDVKTDVWDYMQRYPKYKPTPGVSNGNSYGFKLNLRIDVEPDKTGITSLVNEYNTFSMSLFSDAMARMQDCAEMFTRTRNVISGIENRLAQVETMMGLISDYETMAAKLEELSTSLENANLAFADRSSLLDLIAHVSDNVDSIMSGRANVALQYNTDVIHGGYGTNVDNSIPNSVVINSTTCGYGIMQPKLKTNGDVISPDNPVILNDTQRTDNDVYAILKPSTNMIRIYTDDSVTSAYDINIFIDHSMCNWREGQNLRVVFPNLSKNTLNGNSIVLITGSDYDTKEVVDPGELGDNPIIEFTCVDKTLASPTPFVHDVLR